MSQKKKEPDGGEIGRMFVWGCEYSILYAVNKVFVVVNGDSIRFADEKLSDDNFCDVRTFNMSNSPTPPSPRQTFNHLIRHLTTSVFSPFRLVVQFAFDTKY